VILMQHFIIISGHPMHIWYLCHKLH